MLQELYDPLSIGTGGTQYCIGLVVSSTAWCTKIYGVLNIFVLVSLKAESIAEHPYIKSSSDEQLLRRGARGLSSFPAVF